MATERFSGFINSAAMAGARDAACVLGRPGTPKSHAGSVTDAPADQPAAADQPPAVRVWGFQLQLLPSLLNTGSSAVPRSTSSDQSRSHTSPKSAKQACPVDLIC